MIAELLYTSAPRTLDGPGGGYGVVAKSAGIPEGLEKWLQQLNRYDFALAAEDDRSGGLPVVFSHTTFRDHSGAWHVMSRVGSGGKDYTHRGVFLAHHVAVTADELRDATAAELMHEPSMFQSKWDGHVGLIQARPLPVSPRPIRGRETWIALAGHRDWAEVWVRTWQQEGRPSFVIVPEGADILALFAEASALLRAEEATRTTFLTQMNTDRAGLPLDWIGLPAGSELAESVRKRIPAPRTLDLSRPLGKAPRVPAPQRTSTTAKAGHRETAANRQPAGTTADDFESYCLDDLRPRRASAAPWSPPAPVAAPPPPPPPVGGFWGGGKLLWVAASVVLLSTTLAGTAWKFGAFGPNRATTADPSTPDGSLASNDTTLDPRGRAPAEPQDGGQKRPPAPGHPQPSLPIVPGQWAGTESKPTRVEHIGKWLPEILREAKPGDQWVDLYQIKVPFFSKLKLLASRELHLDASSEKAQSGDDAIRIRLANGGDESIVIQLNTDRGVQIQVPSNLGEELMNRLPLSILEVGTDKGDPLLRLAFTPQLPAVPFADSPRMKAELADDAKRFFLVTHKYASVLGAEVRIEGLSLGLAMVPGQSVAWPLDKPLSVSPGGMNSRPLEIKRPGGQWPSPSSFSSSLMFTVVTRFNRDDAKHKTEPVIDARLTVPPASDEKSDPVKTPRGDDQHIRTPPSGKMGRYDLLVSRYKADSDMPAKGKNQIVIATVDDVLRFRVFDGDGRKVVDTDERKLSNKGREIDSLKEELEALGTSHKLTESEKEKIRNAVASIIGDISRDTQPATTSTYFAEVKGLEPLPKVDDTALLLEVLRRFGRINGCVRVRVTNGGSEEDIEVLRFDDNPGHSPR